MKMEPPRNSELMSCSPKALDNFRALDVSLRAAFTRGDTKTNFRVFETYRSPERQRFLHERGGSTKARAFQSPHQYGLAVDYVPVVAGKWVWDGDHDWQLLDGLAIKLGLRRTISWDRPHIEHPIWWLIKPHVA
jgi:hypothetical protein